MSDTILRWIFGDWSFGRASDKAPTGHNRTRPRSDREVLEPQGDAHAPNKAAADDDLVAHVRAGDTAAFETLFRRFHAPLVRFAASYVGSVDDGEEVVADVLARVWEHRATWTMTTGVSAYLFGAVRNRALDVVKLRARDRHRKSAFREMAEPMGTAAAPIPVAERIERDDGAAAALRLIAKLPERRRLILSLRWNHDLAWDEIATVLGVTSAAVQMEHSRILASLRAEFLAL